MNLMRTKRTEFALLLLGALATSACGDDKAPGAGGGSGGSNGESNGDKSDAGERADAGDAAGPSSDAAMDDGSMPTGDTNCVLEPEELTLKIDSRGSHTWDAVQSGDTMHLAYEVPVCEDQVVAQAQRLDYVTFSSTGAFSEPQKVVNFADDACFFTRTPTLGFDGADKPLLFYSTTASGTSELYQKVLEADTTATRLTIDPDSDAEEHVAVAPFGPSNLVAYVNSISALQRPSISQIVTRRVGNAEQEIVSADLAIHVSSLALAAFSAKSSFGGVLAYVADIGDPATISAQLLDKAGKRSGDPIVLSKKVGAFSNVSIAMATSNATPTLAGAIVYGVAPDDLHTELRFRTISEDGTFGPEVEITKAGRNTQGVSLAPFGDGYIVSYRVIEAAGSSIRVRAINSVGQAAALSERFLVAADASGSPTKTFVTNDGRISVVFSNTTGDGSVLRAVRAICDP